MKLLTLTSWLRTRIAYVCAGIIVATSLGQTAYVLRANRTYERAFAALKAADDAKARLAPGDRVIAIRGIHLDGSRASVRLTDDPAASLVIAIAAQCDFCSRSMPALRSIARSAQETGLRVFWVSRDNLELMNAADVSRDLPGKLIVEPNHSTYLQLKLSRVPHLALLSNRGDVMAAWQGEVTDSRADEIRRVLDLGAQPTGAASR